MDKQLAIAENFFLRVEGLQFRLIAIAIESFLEMNLYSKSVDPQFLAVGYDGQ